jgi:DNA polymerase I-like protein with 3'-5' exonuclease and polymerase domains
MHGLDIETASPDGGGAIQPSEGNIRLIQISDGKVAQVYDSYHVPADTLRGALVEEFVAHNAPFERRWIHEKLGLDLSNMHDTMIMSQVLYTGTNAARNRNLSHKLEAVVSRETKAEIDKDEQGSDWNAEPLTRAQVIYAARDAAVLPELADTLLRKIEKAGLRDVYELELRVSHAVEAMERNGFAINEARLAPLVEEVTADAVRLKAELEAEWGINPGSSKQLIEHFALDTREGWPKTAGGAPSTNQDAMKQLVDEEPSVKKWVEWKEVEKIRSTYGKSLRDKLTPEGRVHARFKPFGTATGRFSSSTPNLQNIPKRGELGPRLRGLFWAGAEDRVLIKADYASIELWVAAILWDDPHMQHALEQGLNTHVATAAALFNVKPGEVTKEQNSRTHHEPFPGLDQVLKAPLRSLIWVLCCLLVGVTVLGSLQVMCSEKLRMVRYS